MTNAQRITSLFVALCATMVNVAGFGHKAVAGDERKLAALPDSVSAPGDNPTTPAKVELGKQLFFDPRLSGDNTMSCATCHLPDKAFGDGLARAKGAGGKELARNTPTLLNVGFCSTYFWDGRAQSLEEQSRGPIQSPDEMNQDIDELVEELAAVPGYARAFETVFGRPVNKSDIANALAAFERTLVTRNSPFDRYLAGDKSALPPGAKEGSRIVSGRRWLHPLPQRSAPERWQLLPTRSGMGRQRAGRRRYGQVKRSIQVPHTVTAQHRADRTLHARRITAKVVRRRAVLLPRHSHTRSRWLCPGRRAFARAELLRNRCPCRFPRVPQWGIAWNNAADTAVRSR